MWWMSTRSTTRAGTVYKTVSTGTATSGGYTPQPEQPQPQQHESQTPSQLPQPIAHLRDVVKMLLEDRQHQETHDDGRACQERCSPGKANEIVN